MQKDIRERERENNLDSLYKHRPLIAVLLKPGLVRMNSAVCTLFEGHYHAGVAALINSLYSNQFRGDFFAGYKGSLPSWAVDLSQLPDNCWPGARTMSVTDDLTIHFLPLDTRWHMTNYKSSFMLKLKEKFPLKTANIFYFDPDIVVKCPWHFFEKWVSHGVALVQEINAGVMPPTHPVRKEWEKVIAKSNYSVQREMYAGINGGFCGVADRNTLFLQVWQNIIECAIRFYKVDPLKFGQTEDIYLFHMADQDALNIAAMCCKCPVSEMGPEAMEFIHGGWKVMSHATGSPKPWKKSYILSALKGIRPSLADKSYWLTSQEPIKINSRLKVKRKRISLSIASLIGRFYRKS